MSRAVPAGYVRLEVGRATAVARAELAETVRDALLVGTLHAYAGRHPERRTLQGRGVAYAAPLPRGAGRVVVRHNHHGGIFARVTGDRFLIPTRAPHELETSLSLAARGVPTPQIVAYALYPAGPLLRRADIASREVPDARDAEAALAAARSAGDVDEVLEATARLVAALTRAGARHHDFNLKNVLLARDASGGLTAYVLDVDRVEFLQPADPRVTELNLRRLTRSVRKWMRRGLAGLTEERIDLFHRRVRALG
ncbi:MAG: lipopolysaccharide kinase InaA family protein [Gemmatimonadaceae bacterium]